jgi:hypothetical protein
LADELEALNLRLANEQWREQLSSWPDEDLWDKYGAAGAILPIHFVVRGEEIQ